MTPELLPCPFCGGQPEIVDAVEAGEQARVVCCTKCEASSQVRFALKEDVSELLAEAWNRRAPTASCEELRALLKRSRDELKSWLDAYSLAPEDVDPATSILIGDIDAALAAATEATASCEELRKALSEARTEIATRVEVDKIGWGISAKSALLARIDAALAATPGPTADRGGEVSVKALEWRDHGPDAFPARFWSAQTPFGRYEIEEETASDSPRYRLEWHSSLITDEDGLDAAKAAAQADYERRIRSALTPTDRCEWLAITPAGRAALTKDTQP